MSTFLHSASVPFRISLFFIVILHLLLFNILTFDISCCQLPHFPHLVQLRREITLRQHYHDIQMALKVCAFCVLLVHLRFTYSA